MRRTYALKRLLEHGALTFGELCEITGWKASQVCSALDSLDKSGLLLIDGPIRYKRYALR